MRYGETGRLLFQKDREQISFYNMTRRLPDQYARAVARVRHLEAQAARLGLKLDAVSPDQGQSQGVPR